MKIRKFLSALLSFLLIFTLSSPAFAIESTNSPISSEIQNQMLRILASTESEKENFGLSGLNFSAVHLGAEIPAYKVSGDSLIPADIRLIPIVDGTSLISFFYVVNDASGSPVVQLSNELIAPLQNYVNGAPFSIIYDDDGAYVFVNDELHLLGLKEHSIYTDEDVLQHESLFPTDASTLMASTNTTASLVSALDEHSFCEATTGSYVTTTNTLDVTSFLETLVAPASTGATSKYLSVEKISQPGETNICWAIAITSIANFIWDGSWTYSNIVQMFSGGADRTMSTEEVVYNFNYYFEADWWYSYTTTLAPNTILNYLLANYPLYGGFTRSGGAHAVVIRGVSTTLNTFSVMNPTPSTTSYTSGTISSNNTLTFVSGYSGSTYTLRSYIYPVLP